MEKKRENRRTGTTVLTWHSCSVVGSCVNEVESLKKGVVYFNQSEIRFYLCQYWYMENGTILFWKLVGASFYDMF